MALDKNKLYDAIKGDVKAELMDIDTHNDDDPEFPFDGTLLDKICEIVAEKVVKHITEDAQVLVAEGQPNHFLKALHIALSSWVPVPMDGGAALKAVLATALATPIEDGIE